MNFLPVINKWKVVYNRPQEIKSMTTQEIAINYRQKVIYGFGWQSFLKIALAGLALIKVFFLARLLDPADFGIFALIAIGLGISEAITQTGINITILQTQENPNKLIDTAWVIAILRGLLIALITILLGIAMSSFFQTKALIGLGLLAALVPIIKGFINPSIAIWQKNFLFKKDSAYHIFRQIIEVLSTVSLALIWPHAAVFVLGMIIAACGEVLLSFIMAHPRPRLQYNKTAAKVIFQNAKGLSITAALSYLVENADDLILGKVLGTYQLGFYHNGYTISHKISYEPAKAANYSLLAVYTKLTHDHQRLWRGFIQALGLLLLGLSITGILMIYGKDIVVNLALGPKWQAVAQILPWLTLAAMAQGLVAFIYTILIAKKNYSLINWHLAVTLLVMSIALWLAGSNYGLFGASVALALSRVILLAPLVLLTYGQATKSKL